jgi:hypothetical protein
MSFILDALKKSDQERQRRAAPSIHTEHSTATEQPWERRRLWPYLVIPALLLNAGLFFWWQHPWESGKPNATIKETHSRGPVSPTAQADRADLTATRDQSKMAAQQSREAKRRVSRPGQSVIESSTDEENARPSPREVPADARLRRSGSDQPTLERQRAAPDRPPLKADMNKAPDSRSSRTAPTAQPPPAKTAAPETAGKSSAKLDGSHSHAASVSAGTAAPSVAEPPENRLGGSEPVADPDMSRKTAPSPKPEPEPKSKPEYKPELRPEPNSTPASKTKPETKPEPKLRPQPKPEPSEALALSDRANTALPNGQPSGTQPKAVGEELKSILDADSGSAEKGVLQFHELPFSVRQALPNLSLSMLIYAQNPADRMVGVNGHVRREGQQVDAGLKLERITPNGAVFSFQGYLFYKGVL